MALHVSFAVRTNEDWPDVIPDFWSDYGDRWTFEGKTITGKLVMSGAPAIELSSPVQIEILDAFARRMRINVSAAELQGLAAGRYEGDFIAFDPVTGTNELLFTADLVVTEGTTRPGGGA